MTHAPEVPVPSLVATVVMCYISCLVCTSGVMLGSARQPVLGSEVFSHHTSLQPSLAVLPTV